MVLSLRNKVITPTCALAEIAEGVFRALDVLFNCVKRDSHATIVVHKKSAPNPHSLYSVIFKLGIFLKEDSNVIAEWTIPTDRATGIAERMQVENL